MTRLYFEDFAVGQKFPSASLTVEEAAITGFAAEFDPQPFHLDPEAARHSLFGELVASGWHTAALTMKLIVGSGFRPAGGILGTGGELTWVKPVRPGDTLRSEVEVLETRASRSRPETGLVKVRVSTFNQHGDTVSTFVPTLMVPRRPIG